MKNYIVGFICTVALAVAMSGGVSVADYTPTSGESAVTLSGVVVLSNASISMTALPTATTGLSTGQLWANSNVVTVAL